MSLKTKKRKTDRDFRKSARRTAAALTAVCLLAIFASALSAEGGISIIYAPSGRIQLWGVGVQYARILELKYSGDQNGTLISTFEKATSGLSPEYPGYPIYVSNDQGKTWECAATIREDAGVTGLQSEWMPQLFELPRAIGTMEKGTLLCAGTSIDAAHSTASAIRLYRSTDTGKTWEPFATVAEGVGKTGVWEPFLVMLDDGRLVCYYSDCTDPQHSQKLSYRVSADGVSWGEACDAVAIPDWKARPGMSVVSRLGDGRYFMTYEMCSDKDSGSGEPEYRGNPVCYRYSDDGLDWGDPADYGTKLVTESGAFPGSSPYNVYSPEFGVKGVIIVTAAFQTPQLSQTGTRLYVNFNYGEGAWSTLPQPLPYTRGGYSHGMDISADGSTLYLVNNIDYTSQYCQIAFTSIPLEPQPSISPTAVPSPANHSSAAASSSAAVRTDSKALSSPASEAVSARSGPVSVSSPAGSSQAADGTGSKASAADPPDSVPPRDGMAVWLAAVISGTALAGGAAVLALGIVRYRKPSAEEHSENP